MPVSREARRRHDAPHRRAHARETRRRRHACGDLFDGARGARSAGIAGYEAAGRVSA